MTPRDFFRGSSTTFQLVYILFLAGTIALYAIGQARIEVANARTARELRLAAEENGAVRRELEATRAKLDRIETRLDYFRARARGED